MKITRAETDWHFDEGRTLFREYHAELNEDLEFQGFDAELAVIHQIYVPPAGSLLLALDDEKAFGCVAIRPAPPEAGEGACEMKHLYVRREYRRDERKDNRRDKLGRMLAEAIMEEGRRLGYMRMVLDTLERLEPAWKLYESLGFRQRGPYYSNPLEGVLYFETEL